MSKSNIVLIGMPGAGKSTVGVVLAKRLGFGFIDTDVEIQAREGRRLQEIIDQEGLETFRRVEEEILLGLAIRRTVIATGGSAVYSEPAMRFLKKNGIVLFLDLELEELKRRVKDMETRGLIIDPGQSFSDLYNRRLPLYQGWAERTISTRNLSVEEVADRIVSVLRPLDPRIGKGP